jgi:hypothetical protein
MHRAPRFPPRLLACCIAVVNRVPLIALVDLEKASRLLFLVNLSSAAMSRTYILQQ